MLLLLACAAAAVHGSVWVVILGVKTAVVNDELEAVVHETTVAAHVAFVFGAVHELLLGKADKLTGRDGVSGLNSTSGRERPAGTALLLVLHRGDLALVGPVNRLWECFCFKKFGVNVGDAVISLESVVVAGLLGLELFPGKVSVLVQFHGVRCVTAGVVHLGHLNIRSEDHKAL